MSDEHAGDSGDNSGPNLDARPIVHDLAPDCTAGDVEADAYYHAVVNGVVECNIFVDVSDSVPGLIHESNFSVGYEVGDRLVVCLESVRNNGDIAFAEDTPDDYRTLTVDYEPTITPISSLSVGESVTVEGVVTQIKQTGSPTVFRIADNSGIVAAAAFEEAGVRAFPGVDLNDVVRTAGTVEDHEGTRQPEIDGLTVLDNEVAAGARQRIDVAFNERAEPKLVEPLVEWPAFKRLRDDLEDTARLLRRTVLKDRPIRVRHHADGDGMCVSVPVQLALERPITEVHDDPGTSRHLSKRLPSKAPFYEIEDVIRDLNFALEGRARHSQRFPFLLMLDNGSTGGDVPAYENLAHYDVPIAVIDHHHPDPEAVDPLLDARVNPYLHDEGYRITTGMMCIELAWMIHPDATDELRHVPAVVGLSDRSKAEVMDNYIALAEDEGYDREQLLDVGEALDYAAHWLRYNDDASIVNNVLNVGCGDEERHRELVELFSTRAKRDVDQRLETAEPRLEHERLDNGANFYHIGLDKWAHRFTYPALGKTTGKLHDRKVRETGELVITIGYGPDFAVLRSNGVCLDIPRMVAELNEEVVDGDVSGGGHLVVGSIKFVSGMREEVIDSPVEKMAEADIDEELSTTA